MLMFLFQKEKLKLIQDILTHNVLFTFKKYI
jgi:hypothetical protein